MIRAYQLMIMRLVLLQEHQSHDHESSRAVVRVCGTAERAAARWKEAGS